MCKCRSHGTFPLFGLQSSHLNICYYHQDLHRRPLRPGSRPRFCSDRRALLLIGAWNLPRRPGIGRALQRHPFSGLVDSAAPPRRRVRVSRARSGDGARTTGNEGRRTTDCRGARRRGLAFGPRPEPELGGATMRDTQADVPSAEWLRAQLAFKNSMIRGILQFTPSIAFRYVLHRCESLDIRCRESFWIIRKTPTPGAHRVRGLRRGSLGFDFLGAFRAGVRFAGEGREVPPAVGGEGATSAPRPPSVVTGSPTETLLRLLLPLNDKVQWTSRDVAGSEPPTSPRSEHFTGPFNRGEEVFGDAQGQPLLSKATGRHAYDELQGPIPACSTARGGPLMHRRGGPRLAFHVWVV
ncbi:hypothetical protein CMV_006912 [Castanea mollissima]|uniref:Uncharacterized protein n=1 Tax=Castanea mollissima TaxID=60419 RepID=A0A8J4RW41_9ROSI|nr:hypothetical protein CMV_006912 [Castanea mollissima]